MPLSFSCLTSIKPKILTKRFDRAPDGSLNKSTFAHVTRGELKPVRVADLIEFGGFLADLKPNQALLYGIPVEWRTTSLVTQAMLDAHPTGDAIARTNRHILWPEGPGIMMLDYDPQKDGPTLSRSELLSQLHDAVPELKQSPKLWFPSASSHIAEVGGRDLTGLRGQRLYIAVADASDIPRIGEQIMLRCWATGKGHVEISKSGSLLKRSIIDASVWQPSRLDFAAGASVGEGLEQRRGEPVFIPQENSDPGTQSPFFDSRRLLPDAPPDIAARAEEAKRAAEEAK